MDETPTQKQARLRREKREKKILEGGTSRLDKITSLSGRPAPEPEADVHDASTAALSPSSTSATESNGRDQDRTTPSNPPSAAEANAAVRDFLRDGGAATPRVPKSSPQQAPSTGTVLPQADAQDPLQQLLQQMMGAPPQADGQSGVADGSLDLQKLLYGTASPSAEQHSTQQQRTRASVWRVLHPFIAFALGLYIYQVHVFKGTLIQRTMQNVEGDRPLNLFWLFATVELVLQSTRYLLERDLEQPGMLATVANVLPEPWKGRAKLLARHKGIWNTLVSDGLVVIWVLGATAWWQGGEG